MAHQSIHHIQSYPFPNSTESLSTAGHLCLNLCQEPTHVSITQYHTPSKPTLNNNIARSLIAASIPVTNEPSSLTRTDGKRPDGLTLIPWQAGKPPTWDVTVVSTSRLIRSPVIPVCWGCSWSRGEQKNVQPDLPATNICQSLAFETHGATHSSALDFLNTVGGRSAAESGDPRETSFLWQRISVLIQRFNAILISETFFCPDEAPDL